MSVRQRPLPRAGGEAGVPGAHRAPPAPPQVLPGSARSEAADMRSVRWALWSPVLGTGEAEVVLPLRGGARRGPCQTLVYRTPASGRSSRQVRARFGTANARGRCRRLGRLAIKRGSLPKPVEVPGAGEALGMCECMKRDGKRRVAAPHPLPASFYTDG